MKIKKIDVRPVNRRSGEPFLSNPKIYIFIENETILENLENRRNRPANVYKKEVLPQVMAKLQNSNPEIYNKLKSSRIGWRQSCGCSMCPCSPGFVALDAWGTEEIFVTI